MKRKRVLVMVLVLFFLFVGLAGYYWFRSNNIVKDKTEKQVEAVDKRESNFILDGYPITEVPLYKVKSVSSSKFFVNSDVSSSGGYFGKPVNYFNVVFETEASPSETLKYYRSLMSDVNKDLVSNETLEGVVGKYKVSISHYGENPKNYAYLQVYLPSDEYQQTNKYYKDYPSVVDIDQKWVEKESSYGLLNQKNGEIEYTQYFPLTQKGDDLDKLINLYVDKYKLNTDFSFDEKTGLLRWKKDNVSVSLTFSKSHSRVYLMMRKPIN